MITTMNLGSYEIEFDEQDDEYGEEIVCAGWNPAVHLACEQLQEARADEQLVRADGLSLLNTRDDIAEAASEMFLRKMYSCQH